MSETDKLFKKAHQELAEALELLDAYNATAKQILDCGYPAMLCNARISATEGNEPGWVEVQSADDILSARDISVGVH